MTTLSAAWSRHEQEQEAADDRYQRELAAHPIEDYLIEAWEHAFDETGFELLLRIAEATPVSALYGLCIFSECAIPVEIDEMDREASQRSVRLIIERWVRDEQERLQKEAIEAIL